MPDENKEWLEVPVFVHGITKKEYVEPHEETYEKFYNDVNRSLVKLGKPEITERPIMVEWGWRMSIGEDEHLADAERKIKAEVFGRLKKEVDFSPLCVFLLRPLFYKLARKVFYFGFDDLFYYISEDGERTVRENLFELISREAVYRSRRGGGPPNNVSLTFVAHSAGTVIAHDFLYHLFREAEESEPVEGVADARQLVKAGNLRIRRFYTMGSPITPLTVRTNGLIQKLIDDEKLNPPEIGLGNGELSNPRWVNFWDKDDIFSNPVGFLYDIGEPAPGEKPIIEDVHVGLGPIRGALFPKCHGMFWTSRKVINYVAKTFW
ncbi:MAG: hypothetical protein JSW52_10580 [Candidatus Coatesbacteria bacterium]|nr:MAG: hypothetical protein JSW52_10580 [Candidatus Coatesbacteria bacterium]